MGSITSCATWTTSARRDKQPRFPHASEQRVLGLNYLAHALADLDSPYWVAGTSTPDWLSVVDRRVRARSQGAEGLLTADDQRVRELARGVMQHHQDDRWFHSTLAFAELNLEFAVELRDLLANDAGFRPSFLGHILVEILLDAELIRADRSLAERYYRSLSAACPQLVAETIMTIIGRSRRTASRAPQELTGDRIRTLVPHFIAAQFLYDYLAGDTLLLRLNQVMARVKLPALPQTLVPWLESARRRVGLRVDALLTPPNSDERPN